MHSKKKTTKSTETGKSEFEEKLPGIILQEVKAKSFL